MEHFQIDRSLSRSLISDHGCNWCCGPARRKEHRHPIYITNRLVPAAGRKRVSTISIRAGHRHHGTARSAFKTLHAHNHCQKWMIRGIALGRLTAEEEMIQNTLWQQMRYSGRGTCFAIAQKTGRINLGCSEHEDRPGIQTLPSDLSQKLLQLHLCSVSFFYATALPTTVKDCFQLTVV